MISPFSFKRSFIEFNWFGPTDFVGVGGGGLSPFMVSASGRKGLWCWKAESEKIII